MKIEIRQRGGYNPVARALRVPLRDMSMPVGPFSLLPNRYRTEGSQHTFTVDPTPRVSQTRKPSDISAVRDTLSIQGQAESTFSPGVLTLTDGETDVKPSRNGEVAADPIRRDRVADVVFGGMGESPGAAVYIMTRPEEDNSDAASQKKLGSKGTPLGVIATGAAATLLLAACHTPPPVSTAKHIGEKAGNAVCSSSIPIDAECKTGKVLEKTGDYVLHHGVNAANHMENLNNHAMNVGEIMIVGPIEGVCGIGATIVELLQIPFTTHPTSPVNDCAALGNPPPQSYFSLPNGSISQQELAALQYEAENPPFNYQSVNAWYSAQGVWRAYVGNCEVGIHPERNYQFNPATFNRNNPQIPFYVTTNPEATLTPTHIIAGSPTAAQAKVVMQRDFQLAC